jgi:hypothetical protein
MKIKKTDHNGGQVNAPKPNNQSDWPATPPASVDGSKYHSTLFDALEQGQSVAMPQTTEAPRPVAHVPHDGGDDAA